MSPLEEIIRKTPELQYLKDPIWRINNLYYIRDTTGKRQKFKLNWAQKELLENENPCKIILKCRQIGITTFFSLYFLDKVLWNDNIQAGIIAQTLDDASNIFKDKLKYAFDHLHPALRALFKTVGDSAKELAFSHGSVIRVGTSLRSSTLQYLHISEFGKICAKDPEKAREIITGSLNTVHMGQSIVIESTAEGKEGYFYDMCQRSFKHNTENKEFGPLDFKPFFFPWWKHPEYTIGVKKEFDEYLTDYFAKLYLDEISLSDAQKWWYAAKYITLKEDMTREYPSTVQEAFSASQDGYWYASALKELQINGRITNVSYDRALPVHCAWDLGQADFTAIWFFQLTKSGEINCIDYFEKKDCPIDQIANILRVKGYTYGEHIWPHDANSRDRAGITFVQQARPFGLSGYILEQHSIRDGINLVRATLSRCWFDQAKCHKGIIALESYAKKWSNSIGGFTGEAVHNDASHGSDAFRYLCAGLEKIKGTSVDPEGQAKALRSFFGG